MQARCNCISLCISAPFNVHYVGLASSFHISVPDSPPHHPPACLPVMLCSAGSITGNPPTLLPSGIPNLIYTDMFSQHRKQPVPLTKLWSGQRMSRGARLQGPIMEGFSSTTSSSENSKGDCCFQNPPPPPTFQTLDQTNSSALKKQPDVLHHSIYTCTMLMIRTVMMVLWKH